MGLKIWETSVLMNTKQKVKTDLHKKEELKNISFYFILFEQEYVYQGY